VAQYRAWARGLGEIEHHEVRQHQRPAHGLGDQQRVLQPPQLVVELLRALP
jgi:hypothetical protein